MTRYGRKKYVFIDESGDTYFEVFKENVSPFYVISAIIIDEDDFEEAQNLAKEMSLKYSSGGEIKSKDIGGRSPYRYKIVSSLDPLKFKHITLVVSKECLDVESGLVFKRSFIKYFYSLVLEKILQPMVRCEIYIDEMGTGQFIDEFQSYVDKNPRLGLYEDQRVFLVESKSSPLIQIADLVAGTYSRYFSGLEKKEMILPLGRKVLLIQPFPARHMAGDVSLLADFNERTDFLIRNYCLAKVEVYLENLGDYKSEDDTVKADILRYLLEVLLEGDRDRYVSTREICDWLDSVHGEISEMRFRNCVESLRDEKIIIASSNARKGYKIPTCRDDLVEYSRFIGSQVVPSLRRIHQARIDIIMACDGFDLSDHEGAAELKEYLDHKSKNFTP